jgi:hypothetical protein
MAYVPRTDGVARIGFELGEMARTSIALSPDTGKAVRANVPRIAGNRIAVLDADPRLYYSFDLAEAYMGYADGKPTGCTTWCTGAGGRLETFEAAFPEFTRVTIGASNDGEDLYAYRLLPPGLVGDPRSGKHFVVCNVVHGNETDGLNGAFKAMEILARHGDFASFRQEWTVLFIPFLNPDGWSVGAAPDGPTRNLTEVGPNGNTINLNRQGDWFWSEYIESGYESKGSAPWSSAEGTALYAEYLACLAAGGSWGVFLDMHATEGGGGARYLTRDRLYQHSTGLPGAGASVPDSYLTVGLDYRVWLLGRAFTSLRYRAGEGPDLWMRLIRSRFSPKLHSYFSSQGVFSLVIEEAKVESAPTGTVSYKSACDMRLDYILATALCCTPSRWSFEDAVLVEKGTTNLLNNASFEQWQDDGSVSLGDQMTDGFGTANNDWWIEGLNWTPANSYVNSAGGARGFAQLRASPYSNEQRVEADIRLVLTGAVVDAYLAARATFDAATDNVADGYKLQYNGAGDTWDLVRVVGGVETVIDSIAATVTTRPTTTYKHYYLRVRYTNPVELYAVYTGSSPDTVLFDTADSNAAKITAAGNVGFGGLGNSTELRFDNFTLQSVKKEERPGWFKPVRGAVSRCTVHEGEKFFEDNGEALKLTSYVDANLTQGAEFCAAALCEVGSDDSGVGVVTSYDAFFYMPPTEYDTGDLIAAGFLPHPTPVGAAVFGQGTSNVLFVLGGGTATDTGAADGWSVISADADNPTSTYYGSLTGMPNLMHAAYCDNTLQFADLIVTSAWRGYLFGGINDLGTIQDTVLIFDGASITTSAQVLTTPVKGAASVYCRANDCCYTFGGMGGAGPVTEIHKYDCAGDTITDLTGTVALPKALAYLAAAYCPGDGLIYLFGGQEASGDMSSTIYAFDPVGQTIEEVTFVQNADDEESEEGSAGDWATKIGRWCAVTRMNSYDDYGTILLIGGRADTTAGDLQETIYVATPIDRTIGLFRSSEYGYVRYSTSYSLKFATQVSEDFADALVDWSDPGSDWTIGGGVGTSSAGGGPLICDTPCDYLNERVYVNVSTTGAIVSFSVFLRADFSGTAIQNGYELVYTAADTSWRIKRWVGGAASTLFTYDASASAARRLDATSKQVLFRVMLRDPVELYAYIVSAGVTYTLFSASTSYDYNAARVNQIGLAAVAATSAVGNAVVDNFLLEDGAHNEERFTCSAHVKADALNVSGYYRFSLMPSSYIDGIWTTRYCSQYYLTPPAVAYYWARGRADLRNGLGRYREDQIRIFHRTYKDEQANYYDGFHLAKGTLIPTSYHPEGLTRADETFTFADVLNPNCFRLRFRFMPTFCFSDLDSDLEIARVSVDGANYLSLTAIAQTGLDRWCREYYQNSIDGPHDPVLRIAKVFGGVEVASAELKCYFGAATACDNDPVNEACEDVLEVTLTHAQGIFGIELNRSGSVGSKTDATHLLPFSSNSASVIYNGVGYYGEPELLDTWQYASGRQLPVRRKGLVDRIRPRLRHAYLSGDRDPTGGVVSTQVYSQNAGMTFGAYDDFTRGDSSSLGVKWLEDVNYYGWRITSNKALAGSSHSYAQVAFPPRHADTNIRITAELSVTDSYVGIRARFGSVMSGGRPLTSGMPIFGYEFRVTMTGLNLATAAIYRYHKTDQATLNTYGPFAWTDGASHVIEFNLDAGVLSASVLGIFTIFAWDDIHIRPRNLGITGLSAGGGYARLTDFTVTANFDNAGE